MFRKFYSFILSVFLVVIIALPVCAQIEPSQNEEDFIVPISDSFNESEFVKIGEISDDVEYRSISILYAKVIRNGTTRECEVYLYWGGTGTYSNWKFSSITVDNGQALNYKKFATIGSRSVRVDPAKKIGSVKIADVKIPYNQKEARVIIEDLKGYNLKSGWQSAYMTPVLAKIN